MSTTEPEKLPEPGPTQVVDTDDDVEIAADQQPVADLDDDEGGDDE